MNKYQKNKEKTRQEAIEWQLNFEKHNYSWGDLAIWENHFYNKARRYGLVKEFKENGII